MGVIIRQSIKGTLVNYLGVAIGFVTTFFVLTSYLNTEEVGLTRVLVDAAILFSSFAQIGTSSSILRFFPYFKDEEGKNHGFFFWTLVVPVVGFLVFLLVFLLLKQPIVDLFSKKSPLFVNYFRFVIPLGLFMLYQSVFEANANVLMRIVVPKFVREVGVRVGLLIIYLLFGYHYIDLDGLVVGFCITYFLAALVNIIYLFTLQKISLKPDLKFITKPLARDFLFYTLFLVLAAIAGTVTPLLSSFLVSAKMGLTFTGVYAIANYVANVVEIPNRSLNAIANPKISEAVKNEDWKRAEDLCKNVSLHLFISSLFIFFMIWINVDLLFMVLKNGDDYVAGKSVIFILGMARLSSSVLSPGTSPLAYSKYYYMSLPLTVLLTTLAILLNLWLIPTYGMNGSAFANFGSNLIYFLCLLTLVKWKLHISIFSWAQLKSLVVVVVMFGLNLLWVRTVTPLFASLPVKEVYSAILDGAVKTGILVLIGITAIYYWKISPEINNLIQKAVGLVRKR
ncbi:MAG: lipopolysaccharide biosynthesis protein [Bacteroidales bacterium]|nr:lipopolysaccharide biosynthesis protein [Bacteroidales bacterium]